MTTEQMDALIKAGSDAWQHEIKFNYELTGKPEPDESFMLHRQPSEEHEKLAIAVFTGYWTKEVSDSGLADPKEISRFAEDLHVSVFRKGDTVLHHYQLLADTVFGYYVDATTLQLVGESGDGQHCFTTAEAAEVLAGRRNEFFLEEGTGDELISYVPIG